MSRGIITIVDSRECRPQLSRTAPSQWSRNTQCCVSPPSECGVPFDLLPEVLWELLRRLEQGCGGGRRLVVTGGTRASDVSV
jgi:hypothetical protein